MSNRNSTGVQLVGSPRIAGLSPEKVEQLRALGADDQIGYRVNLCSIHQETDRYLDALLRSVQEGKQVEEASNYCRWLRFSGVLELLERYSDGNFPSLRPKLNDVLQECAPLLRGGRVRESYSTSDLDELNRKVELILACVARPARVSLGGVDVL
jgi:hypothetical protein